MARVVETYEMQATAEIYRIKWHNAHQGADKRGRSKSEKRRNI